MHVVRTRSNHQTLGRELPRSLFRFSLERKGAAAEAAATVSGFGKLPEHWPSCCLILFRMRLAVAIYSLKNIHSLNSILEHNIRFVFVIIINRTLKKHI